MVLNGLGGERNGEGKLGKKSRRGVEERLGVSRGRFDQNTIYMCIIFSIKIIFKRRVPDSRIWRFKKSI